MRLLEDAKRENPRWTRCAYALGRRPQAWEFMRWMSRCWQEFCQLHGARDATDLAQRLPTLDEDFDAWQHGRVLAGAWRTV